IYVFVARAVLDVLPVWKANPTADFLSVADSSNLFEFVAGIKEGGEIWVFPFDTAQEMFEVLRAQLAYLFLGALELRAKVRGSGELSPALQGLHGTLIRLIIERPDRKSVV